MTTWKPMIIASWMFKGGTSKTTHLAHLAAAVAKQGYHSIMIDADQQCSLTAFFAPPYDRKVWEREMEEAARLARLEEAEAEDEAAETLAALGADEGDDDDSDNDMVFQVKADELPDNLDPLDADQAWSRDTWVHDNDSLLETLKSYLTGNRPNDFLPKLLRVNEDDYKGRLLLLPGSTKLSEYEKELLGEGCTKPKAYTVFRRMCLRLAEKHQAQFVFVDLGPSSNNLNKCFIYSCDFILPPICPDMYSWCAVKEMLCSVLPEWIAAKKKLVAELRLTTNPTLLNDGYFLDSKFPKVLPFLVMQYVITGRKVKWSQANFVQSVQATIENDKIDEVVRNHLIPASQGKGKPLVYAVPFLKSVQAMAVAHELGRPVQDLSEKHFKDYYSRYSRKLVDYEEFARESKYVRERYNSLVEGLKKHYKSVNGEPPRKPTDWPQPNLQEPTQSAVAANAAVTHNPVPAASTSSASPARTGETTRRYSLRAAKHAAQQANTPSEATKRARLASP